MMAVEHRLRRAPDAAHREMPQSRGLAPGEVPGLQRTTLLRSLLRCARDKFQILQLPIVTRPPASSTASVASETSATCATVGFLSASMSPVETS